MIDSGNAEIITSALVFGGAGVAFCTLPFFSAIGMGLKRQYSNQESQSDFITIIAMAFVVHIVFSLLFMFTIVVLDTLNVENTNFLRGDVFGIFWAETKADVFALAEITSVDDVSVSVAYSSLYLAQTLIKLGLTLLPILLICFASYFGFWIATKDSYERNYLSIFTYTTMTYIICGTIYMAWIYISSYALFIPNGGTLLDIVFVYWERMLLEP